MGWHKPIRSVVLWAAAFAAILLLVAGALYVSGLTQGQALGPPDEPVPSAAQSESAESPSQTPPPPMLSDSDLDSIQGALRSGDEDSIRRVLPVAADEHLKAGFSSAVAGMGLTLDKQSQKVIDTNVWEVEAVDSEGTRWTLGLLEANESPRLMYAERAAE